MIYGIGTDIAKIDRFERLLARYGDKAAQRILGGRESEEFARTQHSARFLAKRFAAKEAFGKAWGTGVRAPATLQSVTVGHDALGKPFLEFAPELAQLLDQSGLRAHVSISDEAEFAVAFVVIEQSDQGKHTS